MLDKRRLLSQLQLPLGQAHPFDVEWRRQPDLFEDGFALTSRVGHELIEFDYVHKSLGHPFKSIWRFGVELSAAGRAQIAFSEGIEPPLRTVFRGAGLVAQALGQLQANPAISRQKPMKRPRNSM